MNRQTEETKRDAALAALKTHRKWLITSARRIGQEIMHRKGSVTSTDVFEAMRADPMYVDALKKVDARWMGAVFPLPGTRQIAWSRNASHRRPIPVWGPA